MLWTPYAGPEPLLHLLQGRLLRDESRRRRTSAATPTWPPSATRPTDRYVAGPEALVPGHTYYLRVQVIRATDLGGFLVAQTDVATYTVP